MYANIMVTEIPAAVSPAGLFYKAKAESPQEFGDLYHLLSR